MVAHLGLTETQLELGEILPRILGFDRRLDGLGNLLCPNTDIERILRIVPPLLGQQDDPVIEIEPAGLRSVILEKRLHATREIEHPLEGLGRFLEITGHAELARLAIEPLETHIFLILGGNRNDVPRERQRSEEPEAPIHPMHIHPNKNIS